MRTNKGDPQLQYQLQSQLRYLIKLTRFGLVRWKRTADHNATFTTAVGGEVVATVWEDTLRRYVKVANREGQIQTTASSADSDLVDVLYSEAKKKAFNLDQAITDIIQRAS